MRNASLPRKSDKAVPIEPSMRLARPDSFSERIYLDLRNRLQRCEIGPDRRLVDAEVAAGYGISRMPAREALLRLANEGYLIGTTRGFAIPRLSMEDIRDIFEIRKLLEPHAAANAARDMKDPARLKLSEAIQQARDAAATDNVGDLILANFAFRQAWLSALRNERLIMTIGRFVDHVQTIRLGTLRDRQTRAVVVAGLEGLYAAFMRGDPTSARRRMGRFVEAAEQAYFRVRRRELEVEAASFPATALETRDARSSR
jgi:DNA-binding GntR family transcriptional regulator